MPSGFSLTVAKGKDGIGVR
jgi:hypothetical protein